MSYNLRMQAPWPSKVVVSLEVVKVSQGGEPKLDRRRRKYFLETEAFM